MNNHAKRDLKNYAALLAGLALLLPYAASAAPDDAAGTEAADVQLLNQKDLKAAAPAKESASPEVKEAPETSGKDVEEKEASAPEAKEAEETGGKELDKESGDKELDKESGDEKELDEDAGDADEKEIEGVENEKEDGVESEADDKGEQIEAEDAQGSGKTETGD